MYAKNTSMYAKNTSMYANNTSIYIIYTSSSRVLTWYLTCHGWSVGIVNTSVIQTDK